tara:strand:- start:2693 stop:2923 length:231 start_codon:yes stop_codon:yes gene_type:complete
MADETQSRSRTTISDIIYFYKQQLSRFYKIGIGNKTEFNTVVTDRLLDATLRRLKELQSKRDTLIHNAKVSKNGAK